MKLWHKSVVALAVTSTLLTACGGKADEVAVSAPELVETQAPTVATGLALLLILEMAYLLPFQHQNVSRQESLPLTTPRAS